MKKLFSFLLASLFLIPQMALAVEFNVDDLVEIVKKRGYGAKTATDHFAEGKKEATKAKRKFLTGLIFAIPAFVVGMIFMWLGIMIPYQDYILWAIATPVQFIIGWQFYVGTWSALKNKNANIAFDAINF